MALTTELCPGIDRLAVDRFGVSDSKLDKVLVDSKISKVRMGYPSGQNGKGAVKVNHSNRDRRFV